MGMLSNITGACAPLAAEAAEALAETVWPTRCAICDAPGQVLCDSCCASLPYVDWWRACPRCGAPFGARDAANATRSCLQRKGERSRLSTEWPRRCRSTKAPRASCAPGKTPERDAWHQRSARLMLPQGAARMACKRGSGAHTRKRRRTPPTWVRPRPGACMHGRRSGGDPRDRSAGTAPHVRPARTRPARAHRQPARPFPNAARRNGSCPHPAHRRRVHHRLHHERCLRRPSRGGRGRAALRGVRTRLANAPTPRSNAPAPRINKGFRAFPRYAFSPICKSGLVGNAQDKPDQTDRHPEQLGKPQSNLAS